MTGVYVAGGIMLCRRKLNIPVCNWAIIWWRTLMVYRRPFDTYQ